MQKNIFKLLGITNQLYYIKFVLKHITTPCLVPIPQHFSHFTWIGSVVHFFSSTFPYYSASSVIQIFDYQSQNRPLSELTKAC